jgi:ATP-dependent Lon protease
MASQQAFRREDGPSQKRKGPVICIDELDKMSRQFQYQLLNFLDSGRIKVDHQRKSYDFEIRSAKVFATCNENNRLSKPLQSRFRRLHLPKYSRATCISHV